MKQIVLTAVLAFSSLSASEESCQALFARYCIDPEIKSAKGWSRAVLHGRLQEYIESPIAVTHKEELAECLVMYGYDISHRGRYVGRRI